MCDQPFDARARRPFRGSSVPLLELAAAPLEPVVALAPVPVVALLDAAPPFVEPGPALPGVGCAAPISPAAVPGPMRPALSVSAGDPCAAYAPATAADMQPATNANMSFFIPDLPN
jgi:hypothetical protein